ncbi:formate dehydrogenase subunit gamma [Nocardioides exalbidus]|uniref:Formate dehydrogenase subunit gamma n=1 Tax=Nocardioides exalbidus TaxID=402596 RepID=A0A1H4WQZ0_9ACTN|nr:formate dehydrogenase [Nocardioides exalbidus]SEC94974.1 formate dehydrogenase subunit gamma [Nocardioides exalbidus]
MREAPDGARDLDRFSRAERWVHRSFALLMGACLVTAAILYNGSIMMAVGHRHLVETIHVWCGIALPLPMVLGAVSKAYRADLGRLDRFTPADWRWLRSRSRRDGSIVVGKFNAGQKVNSWLVAASTWVLLGTGALMYWTGLAALSWRSGATFVHDWVALGLGLLVFGHLAHAFGDPEARRGMRTGRVSRRWARAQHPGWLDEVEEAEASGPRG